jgi:hypothetical protein
LWISNSAKFNANDTQIASLIQDEYDDLAETYVSGAGADAKDVEAYDDTGMEEYATIYGISRKIVQASN